ncbi:orotate phosphoribosyltransferase [Coprothermobacteraceae bacterium]|nr:orotate phosphoribosyltransferase [Coprothermobacteraceae bacterium]
MNVVDLLESRGAIWHGHFLLASGKHSDTYIQCQRAFVNPEDTTFIASKLVEKASDLVCLGCIDGVVAPALGAVVIGYEVARQIRKPFIFAEREQGKMTFKRGFEVKIGSRFLLVEDVFTTGQSTLELIELVQSHGGIVRVALSVVQRQKQIDLPVPYASLVTLELPLYDPDNCPLCQQGIPLVKPGTKQSQTSS